MDTDKCAALLCVLESGSITAEEDKLGYTVSGISRMMAASSAGHSFFAWAQIRRHDSPGSSA